MWYCLFNMSTTLGVTHRRSSWRWRWLWRAWGQSSRCRCPRRRRSRSGSGSSTCSPESGSWPSHCCRLQKVSTYICIVCTCFSPLPPLVHFSQILCFTFETSAFSTLVLGVHVCSHYHARRLLPVWHPYPILPTPPVIPTYALPCLDLYCLTCTHPRFTEPTGDHMKTAPSYFASPTGPTAIVHQCTLNCLDL